MPDTNVVVEYLLEHGAKINARNNEGDTTLMIASEGGVTKRRIVAILIQHGANLRLRNKNEQTALMIARHDRVADVAQLLETALARSR
jgi:ankyrin repeat protein